MSTQASQTLFRFVSTRSPQLVDEKESINRFIRRNDNLTSAFYTALVTAVKARGTKTKWQTLIDAVKADTTFKPKTEEELKGYNTQLYDLAIAIAKNKSDWDFNQLNSLAGFTLTVANNKELTTLLWDNLIYQTVTQQSFYCKELCIQLLVALHVKPKLIKFYPAETQAIGESTDVTTQMNEWRKVINDFINATVVLPKELFTAEVATSAASTPIDVASRMSQEEASTPMPSAQSLNRMAVAQANNLNPINNYQK